MGPPASVVLESRGGPKIAQRGRKPRNPDYGDALRLILTRAKELGGTLVRAEIASAATADLPASEREIRSPDLTFPLDLAAVVDIESLRLDLMRNQRRLGTEDPEASGGNNTRRLRLLLDLGGGLPPTALERRLAGITDPPPTIRVVSSSPENLQLAISHGAWGVRKAADSALSWGTSLEVGDLLLVWEQDAGFVGILRVNATPQSPWPEDIKDPWQDEEYGVRIPIEIETMFKRPVRPPISAGKIPSLRIATMSLQNGRVQDVQLARIRQMANGDRPLDDPEPLRLTWVLRSSEVPVAAPSSSLRALSSGPTSLQVGDAVVLRDNPKRGDTESVFVAVGRVGPTFEGGSAIVPLDAWVECLPVQAAADLVPRPAPDAWTAGSNWLLETLLRDYGVDGVENLTAGLGSETAADASPSGTRQENAEGIYAYVQTFIDRCVRSDGSMLWPSTNSWNDGSLAGLWKAFVENADAGKASYLQKLEGQLATVDDDIFRVAADVNTLYLLFPSPDVFGPDKKLADMRTITKWRPHLSPPDWDSLGTVFAESIGSAGTHYLTSRPWQVGYFLAFMRAARDDPKALDDPVSCKALALAVHQERPRSTEAFSILLHLLFPDSFEPMASLSHKDQIVDAFKQHARSSDVDVALAEIRVALTPEYGFGFSFYKSEVRGIWDKAARPPEPPTSGDGTGGAAGRSTPVRATDAKDALQDFQPDLSLDPAVVPAILAALQSGNHILLIGPPGTGKTDLAQQLCRAAVEANFALSHSTTTASADWTTFDTIGGYMPDPANPTRLQFQPGVVLDSIQNDGWLIIDEINRADADKAFGALLTLLAGFDTTLSFESTSGNRFRLQMVELPASTFDGETGVVQVGRNWRIIATMNTRDKNSLYALSYAFMRRFSFVYVGVPPEDALTSLVQKRSMTKEAADLTMKIWKASPVPLGPAILLDISELLTNHDNLEIGAANAVIAYVLPQLEGREPGVIKKDFEHFRATLGLPATVISVWLSAAGVSEPDNEDKGPVAESTEEEVELDS